MAREFDETEYLRVQGEEGRGQRMVSDASNFLCKRCHEVKSRRFLGQSTMLGDICISCLEREGE